MFIRATLPFHVCSVSNPPTEETQTENQAQWAENILMQKMGVTNWRKNSGLYWVLNKKRLIMVWFYILHVHVVVFSFIKIAEHHVWRKFIDMHVPLHSTVYSSQERIVCIILYSYSISRLDCKKVGYSVDVVVVGFLFLVWEFAPLCLGLLGSTCVIMNKSINTVMFGKHCRTIVKFIGNYRNWSLSDKWTILQLLLT